MSRVFKFNTHFRKPSTIDTTTTAGVNYQIYGTMPNAATPQYIEKIDTTTGVIQTWTFGLWSARASITNWVPINNNYIDL